MSDPNLFGKEIPIAGVALIVIAWAMKKIMRHALLNVSTEEMLQATKSAACSEAQRQTLAYWSSYSSRHSRHT